MTSQEMGSSQLSTRSSLLIGVAAWRWSKLFGTAITCIVLMLLMSPTMLSAYAGLGGYISEKLLGSVSNNSLYIGRGTDRLVVLGSAPVITTLPVLEYTASGGGSALLRGSISSLNGMPLASYWFTWGYDPGSLTNTTLSHTSTTTGEKTQTLTGFNTERIVYYSFRASTDATVSGGTESFRIKGGIGSWLLRNLLTAVVAAATLLVVVRSLSNPIFMLIAVIAGILAMAFIQSAL